MTIHHLMSVPADAPEWVWASVIQRLHAPVEMELNPTPCPGLPSVAVARLSDTAWIGVTMGIDGNGEVLGITADHPGQQPDLPMILAALDDLGLRNVRKAGPGLIPGLRKEHRAHRGSVDATDLVEP